MEKDKGTSKQRVSDFVEVAAQWHPTKNGDVTPDQVVTGSHQKYWWKCDKDPEHEWESVVRGRTQKAAGCPFCSGRRAWTANSLANLFPEIAAQWHPTKNGEVTPEQVVAGSHQKYWWKCSKGLDHEWEMAVKNRTILDQGCHRCNVGWTVQAIRGFIESLRPHLQTFSPAELYLLFQQNGLLATTGKGNQSRAAESIGITASSLSRYLKGLRVRDDGKLKKWLDRGGKILDQ